MNVDRRWWGISVKRARIVVAGLTLMVAGCAVLGSHSVSRRPDPLSSNRALTTKSFGGAVAPALSTVSNPDVQSQARALLAGMPLIFEPNQGQGNLDASDARVKFLTRGPGYSLFLGSEGAILSLVSKRSGTIPAGSVEDVQSIQMKLAGANPKANLVASDPLPGKSNYFIGNDPARWRSGIPQYSRVRYEQVYPGVNLVFYGNQGQLEYDFQVAPGADPSQARLEFNGANKLELSDGTLVVKGEHNSVRLEAPRVYQEIAGKREPVEGSFVLRGKNQVGFAIGEYDRSRELIIDPLLSFSTYFGGTGNEASTSIAVDGAFNIYLSGSTTSPDLPAVGVYQTTLKGAQNVYIAKINPPRGSLVASLVYVTYLGGTGTDTPVGIGVDGAGNTYVAGTTSSIDFPVTLSNAYQTAPESGSAGPHHVFVTELQNDATVPLYSSYLSGNGDDVASGMTIDAAGYIYVTGTTTSSDAASTTVQFPASTLPQALPYQTSPHGPSQFFVTKVNTTAPKTGSIAYSTYFGGGNFTAPLVANGGRIAVDTNGNVYFTGSTNYTYTGCSGCGTTDFPILNAYQPCLNAAPPTTTTTPPSCTNTAATFPDAFVAKLNPNANQGEQLLWSTYLGGTGTDSGAGIALDSGAANVYVTGTTDSIDIGAGVVATSASYQHCLDQPITVTTCTTTAGSPTDAFVARLTNPATSTTTPTNVSLNYFSFLGGSGADSGLAIAVDAGAGALVTGWTQSTDFPVSSSSIQSTLNGPQNAFIARLNTAAVVGQTSGTWADYFGGNGTDEGTGIALDVNQNAYLAGDTTSTSLLQVSKPLQANNAGGSDAFVAQLGTAVSLNVTGVLTLGTNQTYVSAGNKATFTYTVTNSGPDLATNITVTDNLSSTVTGVPLTFVSASASSGTCGGVSTGSTVSCSIPSLQAGSTATVTIVVIPTANSSGSQATFNGGSVQVMGPGNIVLAQTSVPATMSDFSVVVTPSNASVVAAGLSAVYQVQLTPHPVYTPAITMSCTGVPTGAQCTFTTPSVTLQGPGSTTLIVTTTARPVTTGSLFTRNFYGMWLAFPGLMLFGAGAGMKRRRILGIVMLCALFAMLLLQPACSKSSTTQAPVSGTPAGTYTITVTATADTDTKSAPVTLTVP